MSESDRVAQPSTGLPAGDDRFRGAFHTAAIGMAIVGLDGRFLDVNASLCRIVGYAPGQLIGRTFEEITHPDDLAPDLEAMSALVRGDIQSYVLEKRYVHGNGQPVWIQLTVSLVRDARGEPDVFIAQVQDISERREFEDRLLHQAFHDPLTGLPNRALFTDRLEQALARARRTEGLIAVLFLDLDNFKVINDSLGHRAGDQLLITIGERLLTCVRPSDTVARLGGDEMAILLEGLGSVADAVRVAGRVAEQSLTLYTIGERQVAVTASIGIAFGTDGDETADDLLRNADTAMYEAKRRGRSRFEIYEPRMSDAARERLELEIDLQRGIERGELQLRYQPVVDLRDGALRGVEALVRWDSPERGVVLPAAFMPVAEEAGLILGLGQWVLRRSCRQLREWQRLAGDPLLALSVNVSTRQFREPALVEIVREALAESGIDPATLRLEISERAVMDDAETTTTILRGLRELGVRLTIDDFGTGFSSLTYLSRFHVDTLKIDHAFIGGIGRDPEATAIVDAVIAIARTLGIEVVAEGIETVEQLEHLRERGVVLGQGYLLAPPQPAERLQTAFDAGDRPTVRLPGDRRSADD